MSKKTEYSFMRKEKKYILNADKFAAFLRAAGSRLLPDAYPKSDIMNIYYDTEKFDLIRASIEKPDYKEKLRLRSYGIPNNHGPVFVEIKKKFDGIVYKRRAELTAPKAEAYLNKGIFKGEKDFALLEVDALFARYALVPKVFLGYSRQSFVAADDKNLRLTLDTDIICRDYDLDLRDGAYGRRLTKPGFCIMEIKMQGAAPMWLARTLSDLKIFPGSFSKYGEWYKKTAVGDLEFLRGEKLCCA